MKKGFTLIELLAVIVILGIIAVITTPLIMGVIEDARKNSAIQSVNGLLEAGEQYQIEGMMDGTGKKEIDLTSDDLEIKGSKPESGTLLIDTEGNMSIIAKYGNYCIEKKFLEEEPTIVTKEECTIEESEKENMTTKIYGVRRKIEESATTWERIEDSINLKANAIKSQEDLDQGVQNDFDAIYPWSGIESYTYDIKKKEITSWYNDNPQTFDFDGSKGEVLTYIPTFYYKRYQESGYEYILISNKNLEGYTRSDAFSIGRYTMSGDDNAVHSKSGVQPLVNTNITQFREYARKLGSEFSQLDYHYFIIQLLYLVEYADYDSQTKLGKGNSFYEMENGQVIQSGGCNSLGMKSGTLNDDGKHSMIYRGMEDIYGNVWQFVDGINIKDHQAYVCYDPNQYESDTFDGCYKEVGYTNANTNAEGYITQLGYDKNNPLIGLPIALNGSSSTYIPDNYWQNSGNRTPLVGGRWTDGADCGLWSWYCHSASSIMNANVGARLFKTR